MLDLLTLGTVMETSPKIAPTRPHRAVGPARLAIASNKLPTGGAYSAYGAFSAHFIWRGSAVYPPVGPRTGTYLSFLAYFAYFLQAPPMGLKAPHETAGSGVSPAEPALSLSKGTAESQNLRL